MRALSHLSLHNFRRFENLNIPLEEKLIVMGPNGAGKTTVLWAIALVLRAYNKKVMDPNTSSHSMDIIELSHLLNYEGIAQGAFLRDVVVNSNKQEPLEATLCATINGATFHCKMHDPYGRIKFFSTITGPYHPSSISFAFVASERFVGGREEHIVTDILTSVTPNKRTMYDSLPQEYKAEIIGHLNILFNISDIVKSTGSFCLCVHGKDKSSTEIMFMGSSFRRTFVLLVLLYKLVSAPEPRVFLVEEPETQLYPTVFAQLLEIISHVTTRHHIQLIMTANSEQARFFSKDEIFVLL